MRPLRADAVVDYEDELIAVIRHDARDLPLEDETVDLIVTSPPYFALRSYRDDGEHYDGQIGSEDTPDLFLQALDECMVEWGRVLKPSGSVWINLGDKYAATGGGNSNSGLGRKQTWGKNWRLTDESIDASTMPRNNTKQTSGFVAAKSLMGLPWRFAIRQIDAGWILRAEVVWDKPNGLPESVTDRVRRSHETWFHFVREPRYFSGVDEIREPSTTADEPRADPERWAAIRGSWHDHANDDEAGNHQGTKPKTYNPLGRLPGSVWTIPSEPLLIPDDTRTLLDLPDHFAAFPQEWPRRIITGWSPTGICTECGEGQRPLVATEANNDGYPNGPGGAARHGVKIHTAATSSSTLADIARHDVRITGYACACPTPDAPTTPSVICDPFGGTGTVAGVAKTLGRFGISNDLSESYNRLAIWRITQSGHFTKTEQRSWADRQGQLI